MGTAREGVREKEGEEARLALSCPEIWLCPPIPPLCTHPRHRGGGPGGQLELSCCPAGHYEEDKAGGRGEGCFSGCKPPSGLSLALPEPLSPADAIGLTLSVLHTRGDPLHRTPNLGVLIKKFEASTTRDLCGGRIGSLTARTVNHLLASTSSPVKPGLRKDLLEA